MDNQISNTLHLSLDMSTQFLVLVKIKRNIIARPKRLCYNKPYTITPDFSAVVYFKENGGGKNDYI